MGENVGLRGRLAVALLALGCAVGPAEAQFMTGAVSGDYRPAAASAEPRHAEEVHAARAARRAADARPGSADAARLSPSWPYGRLRIKRSESGAAPARLILTFLP